MQAKIRYQVIGFDSQAISATNAAGQSTRLSTMTTTAVGTGLKHGSSLITCVIADTKKAITPMATSTYAAYCSTSFIFIFRPFFLLFDSVLSAFHSPIKYHSFLITQRRQFFTGFVPDLTVTISSSFPVRLVDVIQIPTLL